MSSYFLLKLGFSVIVGSAWVTAVTIAAERLGSKIGGLIGGLPSVVLVSYLFIGWAQGAKEAYEATTVFPLTYIIGALCTFIYVVYPLKHFKKRIYAYLSLWLVMQATVLFAGFYDYFLALGLWAIFLCVLIRFIYLNGYKIITGGVATQTCNISLAARASISGIVIGSAVLLSKLGGPVVGSIFASFPGIYLSTLIVADRQGGVNFSRALLTPMMLSGSINCIIYVAVFRLLILESGIIISTAAAATAVLVSGYASHALIEKLFSAHPKKIRTYTRHGKL